MSSYHLIDHPRILQAFFYPRKDLTAPPPGAFDVFIPVEEEVSVACRFFAAARDWPWILYFHGNGEVASDYDDLAPYYHRQEVNLAVADYRGYGASSGSPAFTHMVADAHPIFETVSEELRWRGLNRKLWVMGRSLGSIPALELASSRPENLAGLIVESGFVSAVSLMRHARSLQDVDLEKLEKECLQKVRRITLPALVLHGQYDNLVPPSEGKHLYENLGSASKNMVIIPQADHNSILLVGSEPYFEAVRGFIHGE